MNKNKATYHFHDPNGEGAAAELILPLLLDANMPKLVHIYTPVSASDATVCR